ncbi:hypothetical protein [Paludisphaera sp.]|uniref:hypothetical protein n=1 Tax=Paludisphaera sp. TaxID=2017432 RepID=UPI00301C3330
MKGWRRVGDRFEVDWADAVWTFGFAEGRAGLLREGASGPFLALVGLAAVGRRDDAAFTADSLVDVDVVHGRLLATFEPPGWHGLTVRAGWGPCRDGRGMDLEIQASADSVGELRRLEVMAEARPKSLVASPPEPRFMVVPRDRVAAGSSYDGREPDALLARLMTLEVARPSPDEALPDPGGVAADPDLGFPGAFHEIAHPDDVARDISTQLHAAEPIRYAFFGHDLEKGVVLRGRLRGVFLAEWGATGSERESLRSVLRLERDRFFAEPPPLRTD